MAGQYSTTPHRAMDSVGDSKAHLHENHETAIYMLGGDVDVRCGEGLRECLIARAGDFLYIPAGMPDLPVNRSHPRLLQSQMPQGQKPGF